MIFANQGLEQIVNEVKSRLAFALPHLLRKKATNE
jgi:hypothetical protein